MAKSEYVGLSYGEKIFTQKNMLHSQLELLSGVKKLKNYKKLRLDEFKLKVELKNKIGLLLDDLRKLEKILPEVDYARKSKGVKEKGKLEQEIAEIRKKLAKLS